MSATEEEVSSDGRSAEDLADEALANEPEEDEVGQQLIPGTAPKLSLNAGGKHPTSSEIKLRGGSIGLEGQFEKGETVQLVVEVRIADIWFSDHHDSHGQVDGSVRRHIARTVSVQRTG